MPVEPAASKAARGHFQRLGFICKYLAGRKRTTRRAKIFVQFTQLLGGKEDVMLITKVSVPLRCPARFPGALRCRAEVGAREKERGAEPPAR